MNDTPTPAPGAEQHGQDTSADDLLNRLLSEFDASIDRSRLPELSDEQVNADYAAAYQALAAGRMDDATEAFAGLAQRAPDQHRVQLGFALCLQHAGLIEDALRHYSLGYVLDPSSVACAFRIGECLLATGELELAREALLTAIELGRIPGQDPAVAQAAQELLDAAVEGATGR